MNLKPGVCTFCGTGCGHFISTENNKITRVFPSQNHPVSRGRLCVRGWNIHELLTTPERITKPRIRKNGQLEEATYDDAVAAATEKLLSYGAGVVGVLASPRSSNEEDFLLMRLARSVFKTNNISLDSDSGHRNSLNVLNEGAGMAGMTGSVEEIRKAEFILAVGIDITKQNPIIGSELHYAKRAGSRLVTIDSRNTQIAKLSSSFLQNKPGTNRLVLLAMAKTIHDEGLIDHDCVAAAEGYDAFKKAFETLSESEVADATGVFIDDIKANARLLAKAKTAMAFFSSGISGLDADTIGCIFNLFLMAGKVGREGCGVNPIAGLNNLQGGYDMGLAPDLLTGFQSLQNAAVVEKFKKTWNAELPGEPGAPIYELLADPSSKLKALIVVDHDEGIVKYADSIKKLDFIVYIGAFQNPFVDYAHVVLPIASYIEDDATFTNTERRVQLSVKKVDGDSSVLSGWKLYAKIAEKAGQKWGYASSADIMKEIAALTPTYAGISHEKLATGFGLQWPCDEKNPAGTKRLDYAKAGRKLKFVSVGGVFEIPRPKEEFPYLLMVGKAQHFWHQNNLMKKTYIPMREYNATLLDYPDGYIEVSAASAKEIGVRDRWPVRVVSPFGEMRVAVRVSDDVKPFTAYAPYFVQDMISQFLLGHTEILKQGEDATIPVRIEKV